MPAEGISFLPRRDILSYEEMLIMLRVFGARGINKVRITGGEPFSRKDLIDFLDPASRVEGIENISITTNATLIGPYIQELKRLGILDVNVSLDALDRDRFFEITRRDLYDRVYQNLMWLVEEGFRVKINCIAQGGKNIDQIIPLAELTKKLPVAVRFLEEMPFNGSGLGFDGKLEWNHIRIAQYLKQNYPTMNQVASPPSSTSQKYRISGHRGTVGIIPSYSRTFCGTCNRIRVSAKGDLRTCLYGKNEVNIKEALTFKRPEVALDYLLDQALANRFKDGLEAERASQQWESMTSIGG